MKLAVTESVDPDCPNFALAFYGRGKDYENKDDYDRAIVFPSLRRRFFIPRRLPGFFKTSPVGFHVCGFASLASVALSLTVPSEDFFCASSWPIPSTSSELQNPMIRSERSRRSIHRSYPDCMSRTCHIIDARGEMPAGKMCAFKGSPRK